MFNPDNFQHHSEVVLDACHMIKLVRNSLADLKILKNSKGFEIKWDFIKKRHDLPTEEGLHAENMIRKGHIEVHKKIMKVTLATQVLTKSVTDALHFCRTEMNLSQYQDSEYKEEFLLIFNDLFDITNSTNLLGRNNKATIQLKIGAN